MSFYFDESTLEHAVILEFWKLLNDYSKLQFTTVIGQTTLSSFDVDSARTPRLLMIFE